MPNATLIISQPGHAPRRLEIYDGIVSIGRAPDNTVALEADTDISRYHAVIEGRDGGFWVSDLGSTNGTNVNGQPVASERLLQNGDVVSLGGSTISFQVAQPAQQAAAAAAYTPVGVGAAASPMGALPQGAPAASSPAPKIIIAGIAGGLLLTVLVALWLGGFFGGGCAAARVRITSPQPGSTLRGPTRVTVQADDPGRCIERVVFKLNNVSFASSAAPPYHVMLDPAAIPGISEGRLTLSVTVEISGSGPRRDPDDTSMLAYMGGGSNPTADASPAPDDQPSPEEPPPTQTGALAGITEFDLRQMSMALARQLARDRTYTFDPDFMRQVRDRAAEYATAGYYGRARVYKDVINVTFNDRGVNPMYGYIMAMSRTKFAPARASGDAGQGLWLIPQSLAQNAGYIGPCGTATMTDADQRCAAIVASAYIKYLLGLFEGDFVFAIAAFGDMPHAAAQWKDQLPADRSNFWMVLRSDAQRRDRVIRFFAAGLVGQNPQRFGLGGSGDRPLSELYPQAATQ